MRGLGRLKCIPLFLLIQVVGVGMARGDLPTARLTSVSPLGLKRGTTVEITLGGADLEEISSLYLSQAGLTVAPGMGGKMKITVPPQAKCGPVDVRAIGQWGVSNPRTLWIDDLVDNIEAEPNNQRAEAKPLALESAVNGRMDGRADVDWYKLTLPKDKRVLVDCMAERLDSRLRGVLTVYDPSGRLIGRAAGTIGDDPLLDFVAPVAGDYLVLLHDLTYDGSGEYHYRLTAHSQPRVEYVYPPVVRHGAAAPAELVGRNLPGGQPRPDLRVDGRPLDVLAVTLPPAPAPEALIGHGIEVLQRPHHADVEGFTYRWEAPGRAANPVFVAVSDHVVALEKEPNQTEATATVCAVPAEMVGRLDQVGDVDWFRFSAKKGQVLQIQGFADRAGFPTDLRLQMYHAALQNNQLTPRHLAEYDDNGNNPGRFKFTMTSRDPLANFSVPEDGDYLLEIRDQAGESLGDGRFVYRVRVGPVEQDFRLAVIPADEDNPNTLLLRQGGTTYVQVFALRQGGFGGEIKMDAVGLPAGVQAPSTVIAVNQNEGPLVFQADGNAPDSAVAIEVRGTATINGKTVVRKARVGTLTWSQGGNAPRPVRLAHSLCLAVRPNAPYKLQVQPAAATLGQGSLLNIGLKLERRNPDFVGALQGITALYLPPNVPNQTINIGDKQTDGLMGLVIPNNVPPGTYSMVLRGTGQVPYTKDTKNPKAAKANLPVLDPSPAIQLTVLPRPMDLAVTPNPPTVKKGESVAVKVTVNRVNNYKGPVTLALTLPPGLAGITAAPVTVAPDKNDAMVTIAVAANVLPGDKTLLTIRGTATVNNQPITVDAVLTLKVQ